MCPFICKKKAAIIKFAVRERYIGKIAHKRKAPTPKQIVLKCDQTNTPPTTPESRNPTNQQKSPKNVTLHPPGAIAGACNRGVFADCVRDKISDQAQPLNIFG